MTKHKHAVDMHARQLSYLYLAYRRGRSGTCGEVEHTTLVREDVRVVVDNIS